MRVRGVPSGRSLSAFLAPLFSAPRPSREVDVLQVRARIGEFPYRFQPVEQDEVLPCVSNRAQLLQQRARLPVVGGLCRS